MRSAALATLGGKPLIRADDEGVTALALKAWEAYKEKIGAVRGVEVAFEGVDARAKVPRVPTEEGHAPCTMLVEGEHAYLALTGTNCGYGGTGPHGSLRILMDLGVPEHHARWVLEYRWVYFSRDESGAWQVVGA